MQIIQFQTIHVFIFGAITSDEEYLMYKPENSVENKEIYNFIIPVKTDNLELLKQQLTKSFTGMMKAGA